VDSPKVADLTKVWTSQSPLISRDKGDEVDVETGILEDATAKEFETESASFSREDLVPGTQPSSGSGHFLARSPPAVRLHKVFNRVK